MDALWQLIQWNSMESGRLGIFSSAYVGGCRPGHLEGLWWWLGGGGLARTMKQK